MSPKNMKVFIFKTLRVLKKVKFALFNKAKENVHAELTVGH